MFKNKLLLAACLVLGMMPVFAQNIAPAIEWQKCFGSSDVENISSTIATSDGGFIFIGQYMETALAPSNDGDLTGLVVHGAGDIWVVKLTPNYTIEWQKLLGGTGTEIPTSIAQTTDGGYIITGSTTSNDGNVSGNHGNMDAWVVKLNALGTIQWQKCLGGTFKETGYSVVQSTDGGYTVAGRTSSTDGDVVGNHSPSEDAWVVKLSSIGAIQWQKCLGGLGDDGFYGINKTNDGGYILVGDTRSNNTGDVSGFHEAGEEDIWAVKISSLGVLQWQKCLGGRSYESSRDIIQTLDGGYILTSYTTSTDGDVMGNHSVVPSSDNWTVKLSASGAIQWQRCYGNKNSEIGWSIRQATDSSYVMVGYTIPDTISTPDIWSEHDGWILKISPQGDLLWQTSIGGSAEEFLKNIVIMPDGSYLVTGYTYSNDFDVYGNHGNKDIWLVKLFPPTKALIGKVEQTNTFCQPLPSPVYIANSKVKIEKNNTVNYISTDSLGRFGVYLDTGRFAISAIVPNNLWTACPAKTITLGNPSINDTATVNPTLSAYIICPQMDVQLTTPFLRRCFESQYVINYANKGTAIQNDATAELTLDSALTYVSATRPVRARVGNKITFALGNVGINQVGQFTVNVTVSCDSRLGQTHCSSVIIPKTMTCDTVQDSIPTIITQCIAGCDSIAFLISRPNSIANKTFKYQLIADANLIDTGRFVLTNTFNIKHKKDGRTYRLEVRNPTTNQLLVARAAESSPTPSTPSVSTGFVNQSSNGVKISNISDNCTVNRGAYDPNDKAAVPTGVGTNHYIEQGNVINYMVQFQNTGTDTAFTVVVKDTLAAHFNLSTFKLTATSHAATWQLNPKGILTMTFNNINLVDSFTNERGSHGFFKYSIQLNDSIVTNTIVTNKAGIYFDFNAPIITNLTTHTIGKEGIKNCLIKPSMTVNYSGCPSKNISFTAVAKNSGLNPTYAWFRNSESTPLSTNAVFMLTNAVRGTKIYCKTTSSSDICTETPTIVSDTIVLNCIGTPTNDLSNTVQLFDVYPNPNKGVFTIKLNTFKSEQIQLNILNYFGQTIKSELINTDNYLEQFNLSYLPNGIYVIKLTINGQILIKKVSVQ